MHIAEYKNIINDLRSEIEQLKAKLHSQINDNGESLTYNEEVAAQEQLQQQANGGNNRQQSLLQQ